MSQGKFAVLLSREQPVCPRGRLQFVTWTRPVCHKTGLVTLVRPEHRPAQDVHQERPLNCLNRNLFKQIRSHRDLLG